MANWYVDNAVASSGNGQSWATAWKNFSNIVWASVSAGDSIFLSGGSVEKFYYETLTIQKSGTSGNRIAIDIGANSPFPSGHAGQVKINAQNARSYTVYCDGYDHIALKNFKNYDSTGATDNGTVYINNSDYVIVDGLYIDHPRRKGLFVQGCDYPEIRNNNIHNDYDISNETDPIFVNAGTGAIIEDNICYADNTLYSHNDLVQMFQATNFIVRRNYLEQRGAGQGVYCTWNGAGTSYIYNNVCYFLNQDDYKAAIDATLPTGAHIFHIYNNTIIYGNSGRISRPINCDYTTAYIKNNLIDTSRCIGTGWWMGQYPTADFVASANINNNWWYGSESVDPLSWTYKSSGRNWTYWHTTSGLDANGSYMVNPLVNSADEWRLMAGSPCIGAGINLSAYFTTDKDGNTRPASAAWSIGAYEYGTPATLDQEGFRFRRNDGDEDEATWYANQDENVQRNVGEKFRLRMLVNATGDPASKQFQLEVKKGAGGTYRKVE